MSTDDDTDIELDNGHEWCDNDPETIEIHHQFVAAKGGFVTDDLDWIDPEDGEQP